MLVHEDDANRPAVIVPGLNLAFDDRERITLSGQTIMGEQATREISVCGPGGYVGLKSIAIDVRRLLRALNFEPGERRFGELGPPQKTRTINRRGRTLKITTSLLTQGSCRISRPFGDEKQLRQYLKNDKLTKLRRRLESDAKSLYALYQYGRLHGSVRLLWGFLDERLPAPWVHRDEVTLYSLKDHAYERGVSLEVVVGGAPGWADPWSRSQRAYVEKEGWRSWLVDEGGYVIDEDEIQLARLTRQDRGAS